MKRTTIGIILIFCFVGLTGSENEVKIDYGYSRIFTKEEMDKAIKLIKNEFSQWNGAKLHSITYSSDEQCNQKNITWLNEIDKTENFNQCMMFESDFRSTKKEYGAWIPDEKYHDWQWWLARSENGKWKLVTWGY